MAAPRAVCPLGALLPLLLGAAGSLALRRDARPSQLPPPFECECFGLCAEDEFVDTLARLPVVRSTDSPWYAYLTAVYGEAVPLPVQMGSFELFYTALLPTRQCRVPPAPPRPACAPAVCARWIHPRRLPANASAEGSRRQRARRSSLIFYAGRSNYSFVALQPPAHQRRAFLSYEWAEVVRAAYFATPEGPEYGAWFYPVRGSGVWLNVGRTASYAGVGDFERALRPRVNPLLLRHMPPGKTGWREVQGAFLRCNGEAEGAGAGRPSGAGAPPHAASAKRPWFECAPDLFHAAAVRASRYDSAQRRSTHGRTVGFIERQVHTSPAHEIVVATGESSVPRGARSGCVGGLRAGWRASRPCACLDDPVLNCGAIAHLQPPAEEWLGARTAVGELEGAAAQLPHHSVAPPYPAAPMNSSFFKPWPGQPAAPSQFCTEHWCGRGCCARCEQRAQRPRVLFAHTEKTGGSAVECATVDLALQGAWLNMGHTTAGALRWCARKCAARPAPTPQGIPLAISVRDPYTYYQSSYAYTRQAARDPATLSYCYWLLNASVFERGNPYAVGTPRSPLASFDNFVRWVTSNETMLTQSWRVARACGQPCARAHVLRTEHLEADLNTALQRAGIRVGPLRLPRHNVAAADVRVQQSQGGAGAAAGGRVVWTCASLELVNAAEASIFDQFGYARRNCSDDSVGVHH